MTKPVRYTKAQLVKSALHWGAQNIESLIEAYTGPDGECSNVDVAELRNLRNQMVAYRNARFGKPYDPTDDAVLVDARTGQPKPLT